MTEDRPRRAAVVLSGADLDADVAFLERLGFRVDLVFPAEDPAVVEVSGHGLVLRLERGANGAPAGLRIPGREGAGGAARAPNGTRIAFAGDDDGALPPLEPSFVLTRASGAWRSGRAGMLYRDLIPGRQGGRFVASHIRIPAGGPVPDYVHFHRVAFQMIYCRRGRVRVVYEDQGDPFFMEPGDCVLQPPGIRHRVLESSPGLEVVEITCPAAHETWADHALALPTPGSDPGRAWSGQRFLRHVASGAVWTGAGPRVRDTGMTRATGGLAGARVVVADGPGLLRSGAHAAELLFTYVLRGEGVLRRAGGSEPLAEDDAAVVPAGEDHSLEAGAAGLEFLEVAVHPAAGTYSSTM